VTTFPPSCGVLVSEIWDITSGSEVTLTVENLFVSQVVTDPYSFSVSTADFNKVGSYTLRYKLYIDNYSSGIVITQDFDAQISIREPDSLTISNDIPTTLSYTIGRSAETTTAFTPFTVVPSDYTVNYGITAISPVPADSNLITFSNLTRQISVYGTNVFENGNHNSGQYVPGVYTVTVSTSGDNNIDLGKSFDVAITVVDPCESSTFAFDSTFVSANPITYIVGDPEIIETFSITAPKITQSETITTCPPIEFSVTDTSLNVLATYNAFTFTTAANQFKIESQLVADSTNSPYNLRVHAKYASSIHTY